MKLTEKALDEWRAHPVTETLRVCLDQVLKAQIEAATRAYWAGNPWPELERLALLRKRDLWEDLFEASAEEFEQTMEKMNEYEWTEDAGIQRSGEAGRGGDQDEGRPVSDRSGY